MSATLEDGLARIVLGWPDVTAQATRRFFVAVQNKLHWAIHGQTAAEVIVDRADATKEHMGLHSWTDAPHGEIPMTMQDTLSEELRKPSPFVARLVRRAR